MKGNSPQRMKTFFFRIEKKTTEFTVLYEDDKARREKKRLNTEDTEVRREKDKNAGVIYS